MSAMAAPDVRFGTLNEARRRIAALGLPPPEIHYVVDRHPEWTILAQTPEPQEPVDEGATMRLTVSRAALSKHLPGIYQPSTPNGITPVEALLRAVQHAFDTIDAQLDNLPALFDPTRTRRQTLDVQARREALEWLAGWLAFAVDSSWSEAKTRQLIAQISRLYCMRGTTAGLKRMLEIILGIDVRIREWSWSEGMRIDIRSVIDHDTYIQDELIPAAREFAETQILGGRILKQRTFTQWQEEFPSPTMGLELDNAPLSSVTSVGYYDASNSTQTVASTDYIVHTYDDKPGRYGEVLDWLAGRLAYYHEIETVAKLAQPQATAKPLSENPDLIAQARQAGAELAKA